MDECRAKILVVDDEESNLFAMEKILRQEAYDVELAKQVSVAVNLFKKKRFDLVVTDLRMPGLSGIELIRTIRKTDGALPVIVLTAYGTVNDAVEAMKLGAVDFLMKPVRRESLLKSVQDSLAKSRKSMVAKTSFLGTSASLAQIKRTVRMLAPTNASVLIEGESGTGKEVVAHTIHAESGRKGKLISINCGAIPESLLESELFGYERGAFTGAVTAKAGLFEAANGGTLFLDEIGTMPVSVQVKLLRVLQDGVYTRLGSTETRTADVRIVAATNVDLKSSIQNGTFREDLYFRLNVVSITMPSLRERTEDIPLLAEHFLEASSETYGKRGIAFSADALAALREYPWPGNVRELKNVIERTVVLLEASEVTATDLSLGKDATAVASKQAGFTGPDVLSFPMGTSLREIELETIRRTLEFTKGDKTKAAEILGINLRTIYRKLPEIQSGLETL